MIKLALQIIGKMDILVRADMITELSHRERQN